ncbi:pentapeptide repeat-containing protein [Maribacter sp. 2304DJ31-5]|uniref:pentapeptide repeat-containing protein n=1 Tax=Maribacter sp. 2304DJ31-5 TaxID=3386273 RepID=UPI0039BC53F7
MTEVDFTEANLTETVFDNCDLARAIFDQTNLTKVDLRSAYNFKIDPEKNTIKNAVFSKDNLSGLLTKHQLKII